MKTVNIIGGGLAGSFLAKRLELAGTPHRVFDCSDPLGASQWSENLFSETWLRGSDWVGDSLNFLYKNYPARSIEFKTEKATMLAHHIPVSETMYKKPIRKRVTELRPDGLLCGGEFFAGVNVLCNGIAAKKLAPLPNLTGSAGHVLFFERNATNARVGHVMRLFRPFKHEKVMDWHDGRIRYADSLTVKQDTYLKNHARYKREAADRARHIGLVGRFDYRVGVRPYLRKGPKDAGCVARIDSNTYLVTAGYTYGMILYPKLTAVLLKELLT